METILYIYLGITAFIVFFSILMKMDGYASTPEEMEDSVCGWFWYCTLWPLLLLKSLYKFLTHYLWK